MITNTLHLMHVLGWQGGTVHQVARETGLTVSEILDLDTITAQHADPYKTGYLAVKHGLPGVAALGLQKYDPAVYGDQSHLFRARLVSYWRGALDAQKAKK